MEQLTEMILVGARTLLLVEKQTGYLEIDGETEAVEDNPEG